MLGTQPKACCHYSSAQYWCSRNQKPVSRTPGPPAKSKVRARNSTLLSLCGCFPLGRNRAAKRQNRHDSLVPRTRIGVLHSVPANDNYNVSRMMQGFIRRHSRMPIPRLPTSILWRNVVTASRSNQVPKSTCAPPSISCAAFWMGSAVSSCIGISGSP